MLIRFATLVALAALLSQADSKLPIAVHVAQQTTKYAQVHKYSMQAQDTHGQQKLMFCVPCQIGHCPEVNPAGFVAEWVSCL